MTDAEPTKTKKLSGRYEVAKWYTLTSDAEGGGIQKRVFARPIDEILADIRRIIENDRLAEIHIVNVSSRPANAPNKLRERIHLLELVNKIKADSQMLKGKKDLISNEAKFPSSKPMNDKQAIEFIIKSMSDDGRIMCFAVRGKKYATVPSLVRSLKLARREARLMLGAPERREKGEK